MEGKLWIVNCDESAVRELLILAEDMLLYVPEYFRGKHRMDGELADLRARLGLGVFRPIDEPDGEHYYPCKPDILAASYDPVEGK